MFLSSENTSKFPLTTGASADLPPPDQPTGITVTMEPAGHRGFFLLRHRRLASCRHRRRLPLFARRVVALMDSVREAITAEAPILSGPAVSTTIEGLFRDPKAIDLVACVRCPSWPSEEFATRRKPSGWPSAELVARLCRTAAFLVPVGFAGSETEALEWRLSFSRHEYIAFRSMTEAQRVCLTTLKHCKAVVGAVAKPLKSYYLKTALLWLVESRVADQWTLETMHHSLLLILRYLDACLRHDYLPCYFWPEVNLLASRSAAERTELSAAVAALRQRLLPAVMALLADWLGQPLPELARRLLLRGNRLMAEEFLEWTMTSALCQALVPEVQPQEVSSEDKMAATSVAGQVQPPAARSGGSDSDYFDVLTRMMWNYLVSGRNVTMGSLYSMLPHFPGMTLGKDVLNMLQQFDELHMLRIFQRFSRRGTRVLDDSWFEEN